MIELSPLRFDVARASADGQRGRGASFQLALEQAPERETEPTNANRQADSQRDSRAGAGQDPLHKALPQALPQMADVPVAVSVALEGTGLARAFGLHLQAAAYLSERGVAVDTQPGHGVEASQEGERMLGLAGPQGRDGVAASGGLPASGEDTSGEITRASEALQVSADEASNAGELSPAKAQSRDVVASEAWQWPARSMRLRRRADSGHEVWIRDYRLSEQEAHQLAQATARTLQAQGMTIACVMCNGRQAWPLSTEKR